MAKTERIHVTTEYDGTNAQSAALSFGAAMREMEKTATAEGRVALFDTLQISFEREESGFVTATGRRIGSVHRSWIESSVEAYSIPEEPDE